jgi:electron transport complex protein RnfB
MMLDLLLKNILPVVLVIGGLGLGFGVLLPILQLKMAPKTDPRIEELAKLLPGYNCGSCGNPGCQAFAEQLLAGNIKELKTCKPGARAKNYPLIIEYLQKNGITDVV